MSTPTIVVTVYKTNPPRYQGKARRQPWRWNARNAGNNEIMASGEAYGSEVDAIAAVVQLFGQGSSAYREGYGFDGRVLLRQAAEA